MQTGLDSLNTQSCSSCSFCCDFLFHPEQKNVNLRLN